MKKSVAELALGSYSWRALETEHIIDLREDMLHKLSGADLIKD